MPIRPETETVLLLGCWCEFSFSAAGKFLDHFFFRFFRCIFGQFPPHNSSSKKQCTCKTRVWSESQPHELRSHPRGRNLNAEPKSDVKAFQRLHLKAKNRINESRWNFDVSVKTNPYESQCSLGYNEPWCCVLKIVRILSDFFPTIPRHF